MVAFNGLRTVVLGASPNPARYAHSAVLRLAAAGHTPIPVGIRPGKIGDHTILVGTPSIANVDTLTLYVGPRHQDSYRDYIASLSPRRVIFNPGTENVALAKHFRGLGIETENACTLVLLSTGQFADQAPNLSDSTENPT
ncbi:MAG: CoA-binding protein [Saprospiraceae bacterium]|nr:CoA-binding protein [Saprospiraceae bacterium]